MANFDAPNNNWSEKLNEWLQHGHDRANRFAWSESENVGTIGNPKWVITPIWMDQRITECTGEGNTIKVAKNDAARKLADWDFQE